MRCCLFFPFIACENQQSTDQAKSVNLKYADLQGKIFEIGGAEHYVEDSCKMIFECDCCAGSSVFNTDSTFYRELNCMADYEIFYGKYEIKADKVNLFYTQNKFAYNDDKNKIIASNLNEENTPKPQTLQVKYCTKGNLLLENIAANEMAVITKTNYKDELAFLQKQGVLKFFQK